MPGIFGVVGCANIGETDAKLHRMQGAMLHEQSYSSGRFVDSTRRVGVGWVAHRGSFADCMPVWNEAGNVCLVFTGEEFGGDEHLRRSPVLLAQGESVDARYLVRLYEQYGAAFFEKLNGWFSGLLIDLREGRTILFNDRFGLQRLYYHESAHGFYFASEAKAILQALPSLRQLDLASFAETFSTGCVLQNRTMFSGIKLLPGASRWTVAQDGSVRKESYFSPEQWEGLPILSSQEYYEKLKETFTRVLPRYLRSNNRLAMSLTGGLDGRLIMAWAHPEPGALPCYTFGGPFRDCADVRIARQVARVAGQPHQTISVEPDFFPEFPRLAEKAVYVSDGTMDVGASVELYVNRLARDVAPVRLTGNYGSEIVRGNVAFRPGNFPRQLLAPEFSEKVEAAAAAYESERATHPVSFIAFKQVPWHHYARFSVEQSQLTLRSPYLDNELVALMYQAPFDQMVNPVPSLRLVAEGSPRLASIPTDRGLLYRPRPVLSRLNGIVQGFTVKAEYAYDYGMPQWMARIDHLFQSWHLERLFLGRHKFYHFRVWYRDHLAGYLKEILLDPRSLSRSYLDGRIVERTVNDHIEGRRNYTSELHRLLTAELFHRTLIDAS
jgi:asparagine synthase (glutamine-hydrolysing)